MEEVNKNTAMQLLTQCKECGIFTQGCNEDMLDMNLIESGVFDSMSLVMLASMINKYYGVVIQPSQFVAELRSLNDLAGYLEQN